MANIKNRTLKRIELYERLEEFEGLTVKEMVGILINTVSADTLKYRLYSLRRQGRITFERKEGRFYNFKIIDKKYLEDKRAEDGKTRLSQAKLRLYVEDVVNMREIANNPAIKASDRIKATEAKQKALKHLESEYALELLTAYGLDLEE